MEQLPPDAIPQTVTQIMALCGIPNAPPVDANMVTPARFIALEIFGDSFCQARNIKFEQLEKELAELAQIPEQPFRVPPRARNCMKAFIAWAKECEICGFDPATTVFPVEAAPELIELAGVRAAFIANAKITATAAKPNPFKSSDTWAKWAPLVVNFLRQVPNAMGIPLSYVIRDVEQPIYDVTLGPERALNRYVMAAPLDGPQFKADTLQVHTYIASFIAGNTKAEATVSTHAAKACGRTDWAALKATYEGTGVYRVELLDAERVIDDSFFAGEKAGYTWTKFEQELVTAFHVLNSNAGDGIVCYSDTDMTKLLVKKTSSYQPLVATNAMIMAGLSKPVPDMSFEQALALTRQIVQQHVKPGGVSNRNIRSATTQKNNKKNAHKAKGKNARFKNRKGRGTRNRNDEYTITLKNGNKLNVHPSYDFSDDEIRQMQPHDWQKIRDARAAYKAQRQNNRSINATNTNNQQMDAATLISALTGAASQSPITVAQTNTDPVGTVHGGRNEQAMIRGNRSISYFQLTRSTANDRSVQATRSAIPQPGVSAANECDSNADTCCTGKNFVVLSYTNRTANVYPYDASYEPVRGVPIVSAATAWTNPVTGETVILVLNECLYYGSKLPHTLWNPNQLRYNGVTVNDNPFDPSEDSLTLQIDDLVVPLESSGTKIQFFSRTPTQHELDTCCHLHLTNENEWNPRDVMLQPDVPFVTRKVSTDTLHANVKSLTGMKYAQVYWKKGGLSAVYPMKDKTGDSIGNSLHSFCHEFGALVHDGAAAQVRANTRFQQMMRRYDILSHVTEKDRPNQNPVEQGIGQLKMKLYRAMHKRNVPRRLWDYGLKWVSEIGNLTVNSSKYSDGRTPLECLTGETPDISEYTDFGFYDYVVYRSNAGLGENSLGRWLGVSHRVGNLMAYWVLPESGIPISVTTVQRLTRLEMQTDEWKARMADYECKLKERLGDETPLKVPNDIPDGLCLGVLEWESQAFLDEFQRVIDDPAVPHGSDDLIGPNDNSYVDMRLSLKRDRDGKLVAARVVKRATDDDGKPLGTPDDNPLLNTSQYVVEYIDGVCEVLTANTIAQNILSQVDDNGYGSRELDEILDHRATDEAVPKEKGWITTGTGTRRRIITTKGWEILVRWKDGSTDWIALKDLKNTYPVELAEYAVKHELQEMPAFAYWYKHVLKKRDRILSKLKTTYWERTHKYGIRIPKTMKEALQLDKENGNTYCDDPVKVLKELGQSFQFKNDEIKEPDMYLGATLKQRTLDGVPRWSVTSDEYLKAAVENLERQLDEKKLKLPNALSTPTNSNIVFELDDSRLLDEEEITHFQELIGILRWATELGRIDILLEVSLLSSFQAMPRWNHLQEVYRIFAFIKKNPKFSLYMSPELPKFEFMQMTRQADDFKEHYRDAKEELPPRMLKPRGKSVVISAYVDASRAANQVTRQSHTGIQIFVNRALTMWFSKKQSTVESSAFASEFIAMKTCIEMIVGLRYKLRMMGVPLDDEPSKIFCDNNSVVLNSSQFSSTLSKKHNSVAYHLTQWHVAAGIIEVIWIPTHKNLADTFTK
ncbi:hypothetical protein FisN_18Lu065 [Fistulifera solaris]|uniref:Integrase catalytic domain-containing protein n=1 Tax=Fistulifera solaris TaxID=1519565 RepID=A0A1Z5KEE0_FISSO|nr:hypothetical protein FisN_18Lu065 [Fistulifera solaris]|eukprot:GAX24495.1 hypothetical protein FisN_18Lu065 [Fistulifera solaris]